MNPLTYGWRRCEPALSRNASDVPQRHTQSRLAPSFARDVRTRISEVNRPPRRVSPMNRPTTSRGFCWLVPIVSASSARLDHPAVDYVTAHRLCSLTSMLPHGSRADNVQWGLQSLPCVALALCGNNVSYGHRETKNSVAGTPPLVTKPCRISAIRAQIPKRPILSAFGARNCKHPLTRHAPRRMTEPISTSRRRFWPSMLFRTIWSKASTLRLMSWRLTTLSPANPGAPTDAATAQARHVRLQKLLFGLTAWLIFLLPFLFTRVGKTGVDVNSLTSS